MPSNSQSWRCLKNPHTMSIKNFTLLPLLALKQVLFLNSFHPFHIVFHIPTPYPSLASRENQPPSSFPNFPIITCFQRDTLSNANFQHHFTRRDFVQAKKITNTQPVSFLTYTHWINSPSEAFFSKVSPPHKTSLWIFSSMLTLGITNKDMK